MGPVLITGVVLGLNWFAYMYGNFNFYCLYVYTLDWKKNARDFFVLYYLPRAWSDERAEPKFGEGADEQYFWEGRAVHFAVERKVYLEARCNKTKPS